MYNSLLKALLIAILVGIVGVTLYTFFSGNTGIDIIQQRPISLEANNTKVIVGNITITGQGELIKEKSGQIAGVLEGPTLVNITP